MNAIIHNSEKKVRQSNNLIESPYSQEFTTYEIKIFELSSASVNKDDLRLIELKNDKEFSISNNQLAKLLNTKPNVISMEMEKTAARIMKKTLHLRKVLDDGSVEFEMINIIPYARYKNGIFNFRLNYSIIPYLIELNTNFTEFQLSYVLRMATSYSVKLYKMLYQYKNIKRRLFSIDEIKKQFGLSNKYQLYADFNRRIIKPSVQEINEHTDLSVDYKEIKIGRKVEKIEFTFDLKKPNKSEIKNIKSLEMKPLINHININEIPDIDLSDQTKDLISKYAQEKGGDYVEACINYAKRNAKSNLDKYLADTLTKGWADLEIKKIEIKKKNISTKVKKLKLEEDKKKQEKDQETLSKSEIEHEWNKLLDSEKQTFVDYSDHIIKKYNSKLTSFKELDYKLPLSIFAVNNNKFYDRGLEGYLSRILNISLNINTFQA